MERFRQAYWRELPFCSPGDLPDPGTEPWSPAFQADFLLSEKPRKAQRKLLGLLKTVLVRMPPWVLVLKL